ncbi:OmpA family protein [Sphingoaurantiacus capsulatus]|uniref:OmpA family protein n=1 Tax=Sphingoaurantiacus capsulatus TaxID=1771310 RepID=A0ABV7XCA8_9SPHN
MNRKFWLAATAATMAISAPALADKEDRIIIEQAQAKIFAAKGDANVARYGGAQLDEADRAIADLRTNLDNDDAKDSRNILNRIDALVETAKVRARTAALKDQVADANTQQVTEVADAQARAAAAEREASAAKAQANNLRTQLRDYQLRQTALGAQLVLQDVIFETGKATLRPGATARLQPLVTYLNASPEVKVRIDGHTDSVGSDAMNLQLSKARAGAVRSALVTAGVDAARIQAVGHGETNPVATNVNAAGRQANRRVELTMIGQQLDRQVAVVR